MSRSLHSSIEYLGGSNRWSRNDSDMDPEKSSIGEISSKISSRPDLVGTSLRRRRGRRPTRACHAVVAEQPVEAVGLQGEEVRDLEGLADLREGDAARGRAWLSGCWCWTSGRTGCGARGGQEGSFQGADWRARACRTARVDTADTGQQGSAKRQHTRSGRQTVERRQAVTAARSTCPGAQPRSLIVRAARMTPRRSPRVTGPPPHRGRTGALASATGLRAARRTP